MNEHLRAEYEKYLARYGLKPRKLPSRQEREAGQRNIVRIQYEEAKERDDPTAESILIGYEKNRERYLAETRHPASIVIENTASEVEATICALPAFAEKFNDEVFVGEFPTGSVNCQTVKVDGGFLVLVNSGTLMMLQQVVTFLWRGNADDPKSRESLEAADGVAEVLAAYAQHGDPFYGPKPLVGGMPALGGTLMTAAATKFVLAHEYGHILAGHLAEANVERVKLETEVGALEVLRKNHAQEFEADEIGYRLTLGVASIEDFDLGVIDAGNSDDLNAIREGCKRKCLIAGPFVALVVDAILHRFYNSRHAAGGKVPSDDAHPLADDRIEALLARCPGKGPRHSGFINFPFMLLPSWERMVGVMTDRIFREPPLAAGEDNDKPDKRTEWFDDIMRCVEAIRGGDYAAAALSLTDSFEKQRTIIEPDVGVVRRELVRGALGRATDIRRTLLDRHRDRRAVEQYVESAVRSPFAQHAGTLPGRPHFSVAGLADLGLKEEQKGLGLVQAVMEEEATGRASAGAEVHLLDAVLFAGRNERERSFASFQDALAARVADPQGRLERFVALEKRALELGVELDIQKLLEAVGLNAIQEKKEAARQLACLVKDYAEYLGVPLGPLAQRMVDTQMPGDSSA
jgi:hypothetical protein